jgi:hypothetical protein
MWGGGHEELYILGSNDVQSFQKSTDISKEHAASIFSIEG